MNSGFGATWAVTFAIGVASIVCTHQSINAAIIAQDDFESYTAGASLDGGSGGSGWTSNWTTTATTVESGVIPNFGQSMAIDFTGGDNNNVVERDFAGQAGTTYIGFRLRTQAFDTGDFLQIWVDDGAAVPNQDNAVSGGLRNAGVAGDNFYFIRLDGFANSSNTTLVHPDNTTRQVVMRFDNTAFAGANFDQARIYINQVVEGTPDAMITGINSNVSTLSSLHIRAFSFEGSELVYIDNLKIGTTYADAVTIVPVPAALPIGLMGLAGVAYLRRRRAGQRQADAPAAA